MPPSREGRLDTRGVPWGAVKMVTVAWLVAVVWVVTAMTVVWVVTMVWVVAVVWVVTAMTVVTVVWVVGPTSTIPRGALGGVGGDHHGEAVVLEGGEVVRRVDPPLVAAEWAGMGRRGREGGWQRLRGPPTELGWGYLPIPTRANPERMASPKTSDGDQRRTGCEKHVSAKRFFLVKIVEPTDDKRHSI